MSPTGLTIGADAKFMGYTHSCSDQEKVLGIRKRNMPRVAFFALFVAGLVLVNCGAW